VAEKEAEADHKAADKTKGPDALPGLDRDPAPGIA